MTREQEFYCGLLDRLRTEVHYGVVVDSLHGGESANAPYHTRGQRGCPQSQLSLTTAEVGGWVQACPSPKGAVSGQALRVSALVAMVESVWPVCVRAMLHGGYRDGAVVLVDLVEHPVGATSCRPGSGERWKQPLAARMPDAGPVLGPWPARIADLLARLPDPFVPPLVWDDFADNVWRAGDGRFEVSQAALDLLTLWTTGDRASTALLGSRLRFDTPPGFTGWIRMFPLTELSPAATRMLIRQLPPLNALDEDDRRMVVDRLGGHPGALTRLVATLGEQPVVDAVEWVRQECAEAALAGLPCQILETDELAARIAAGVSVLRTRFWKTAAAWQVLPGGRGAHRRQAARDQHRRRRETADDATPGRDGPGVACRRHHGVE